MSYARLAGSEHAGSSGGGEEMGDVEMPQQQELPPAPALSLSKNNSNGTWSFKILVKEASHEVTGLLPTSTALELKQAICAVTQVPVASQRLVYQGKLVNPNEKKLVDFKLIDKATIHLFPLQAPSASSASFASAVVSNPMHNPYASPAGGGVGAVGVGVGVGVGGGGNVGGAGVFGFAAVEDPFISQYCREVKLWSVLLVVLSCLSIYKITNNYSITGTLGVSPLDSATTALELLCSFFGVWVGNMGVVSSRTADLQQINKYVKWLWVTASLSLAFRVAWVCDVIVEVRKAVDRANKDAAAHHGSSTTPPAPPPLLLKRPEQSASRQNSVQQ